jgi:chorismate lyase
MINNKISVTSVKLLKNNCDRRILCLLKDKGSLTASLKQEFGSNFFVKVIKNKKDKIYLVEKKMLAEKNTKKAFVREVFLYGDGKKKVFARTIIPLKNLKSPLSVFTKIGNKPLGEILFKQKKNKRKNIQIIKIKQENNVIYGRISQFFLHNRSFLLTEVFLK